MKALVWWFFGSIVLSVSSHVTASESGHSHGHTHGQVETSSLPARPDVALHAMKDAVGGWNLHVNVTNFRFAPEHVNNQPVAGEGHANLYVDGKKVARLYSSWFHIDDLPPGLHTLMVTLNANNHAELVLNGEPISAIEEVPQE